MLSRVDVKVYPNKGGGIRIGHMLTRVNLFLTPTDISWKLQVVDYDNVIVSDFHMGVAEFICRMYEENLEHHDIHEIRELIWGTSTNFYTPCQSTHNPL